jgi:cyanophycinase
MRHFRGLQAGVALALIMSALPSFAQTAAYKYFRVGNAADAQATPRAGFALMGGGEDLDEAFRFLCERSDGGDLIVLRSHGDDDYNPYIAKLCKLNSVATLIIPSRAAAADPAVAEKISRASAIFIAGGDQGEYMRFWKGTPVNDALNDAIQRGVPMGGTSAGLAVLGEFIYTSLGDKPDDPNLDGKTAMADPFGARVALDHGFLDIPILKGILTDTHFATRNRMGRLLTFLARLNTAGNNVRGIGVEQRAAVLLEPDGNAKVVGYGDAYFIDASGASGTVTAGKPLSYGAYAVQKVSPGHAFNVKTWTGDATHYTLSVEAGAIHSTQAEDAVY